MLFFWWKSLSTKFLSFVQQKAKDDDSKITDTKDKKEDITEKTDKSKVWIIQLILVV